MSNVEGMNSVCFKKTERSETILRNSAVRYSLFCGSLFRPCEVSYKGFRVQRFRVQRLQPMHTAPNINQNLEYPSSAVYSLSSVFTLCPMRYALCFSIRHSSFVPPSAFRILYIISHRHTQTHTDRTNFDIKISACVCVRRWLF
jgi:hypothetical protein